MERLTIRGNDGKAYIRALDPDCTCNRNCQRLWDHFWMLVDRLAAYEDTGLELDDEDKGGKLIKASDAAEALSEKFNIPMADLVDLFAEIPGVTVDRLQSLARADRDGRLVVLPVPVGTGKIVYMVYEADNGERRIRTIECDRLDSLEIWDNPAREVVIEADGWEIRASDVGKTVFLTYKEAEAALEGG